jgi:hypothetical protein
MLKPGKEPVKEPALTVIDVSDYDPLAFKSKEF